MSDENLPTAAWDGGKLPSTDSVRRLPPREREAYTAAMRGWLDDHGIKRAYEAWVLGGSVHAHVYLENEEGRAHFIHTDDNTPHLGHACGCEHRAIEVAKGIVDKALLRQPPSPLG